MDAAIKAEVERITRDTIAKLREALEDCKAGRYASASCAATEAKELAELLNDEMYTAAQAVYQWPDVCPLLPSIPPAPPVQHAKPAHPYPIYFSLTERGATFNPGAPRQDSTTPDLVPSNMIKPL